MVKSSLGEAEKHRFNEGGGPMIHYVALLRAVNVGGTGKLAMSDLRALCAEAGFSNIETYIASGNVVFDSAERPASVKRELEDRLARHMGKPVGVIVRTAEELAEVVGANPFAGEPASRVAVIFLDTPVSGKALAEATGIAGEKIEAGKREIYVHYPSGQGRSKLRIPAARAGTARNVNTVARLAAMAGNRQA